MLVEGQLIQVPSIAEGGAALEAAGLGPAPAPDGAEHRGTFERSRRADLNR
jgi:hypothetical protein